MVAPFIWANDKKRTLVIGLRFIASFAGRHKKKLLLLGFLTVFGGLWSGTEYMRTNRFCSSCHSMKRFGQSWTQDAHHNTVDCVACHLPQDFPMNYLALVRLAAKDAWAEFISGDPPRFNAQVPVENCLTPSCHGEQDWDMEIETEREGPYRSFRHHPHFDPILADKQELRCTSCHAFSPIDRRFRSDNAKHFDVILENCLPCHVRPADSDTPFVLAPNESCLDLCHPKGDLSSRPGHPESAGKEAGSLWLKPDLACSDCHSLAALPREPVEEESCLACHEEIERSPETWRAHDLHALHTEEKRSDCTDCHAMVPHTDEVSYTINIHCVRCHEQPHTRFEASVLVYYGGLKGISKPAPMALAGVRCHACHEQGAEGCSRGSESCARCHDDRFNALVKIWRGVVSPRIAEVAGHLDQVLSRGWLGTRPAKLQRNFDLVLSDGSEGVHNTEMVLQLLASCLERVIYCSRLLFFSPMPILTWEEMGAPAEKPRRDDPAEDRFNALRARLELKGQAVMGEALDETCTSQCHLDFPFDAVDWFNHETHSPEKGFDCGLCHFTDPLPSAEHGMPKLNRAGCQACHHGGEEFPSCDQCHGPVKKTIDFRSMSFDHEKHATSDFSPSCVSCHENMARRGGNPLTSAKCLDCHHAVMNPPTTCRACHSEEEIDFRKAAIDPDFDHGLHTWSPHLERGCLACHVLQGKIGVPQELGCLPCHHPEKGKPKMECAQCHTAKELKAPRPFSIFSHEDHHREGLSCNECHSMDKRRTPVRGADCGGCHHAMPQGCRNCHRSPIDFTSTLRVPALGREMPFPHAAHEKDDCTVCHLPGPEIRKGFSDLNCADCHHREGVLPSCETCHSLYGEVRSGMLPSGHKGAPEEMFDILSCTGCHRFEASAYRGVSDGRESCVRCHPDEYARMLEDRRKILENALDRIQSFFDPKDADPVKLGLHNFRLTLEAIRRSESAPPQ